VDKQSIPTAGLSPASPTALWAAGHRISLEGGGTIEHAQAIANHESPKTTKLYDRTSGQIDLDEIEKIRI
jgi:hypothetical protein